MNGLQRASILLSLVENLRERGSWCGETHIQKSTYFLQELLEVPLEFEFILYKHGPFSFDLSDEITAMRADALLRLQPQPHPYGPSLIPDEGTESIKKRFAKTQKKYARKVEFVADKLRNSGVANLERYATALYVIQESNRTSDAESRASRIHDLKPHISIEEGREALRFVDCIGREAQQLLADG
jgi:uncharacterized protein YwgA